MKILIITAVFPPEPVVSAKISRDLALALSENHDVTVIAPRPSRPYGFNFYSIKKHDEQNCPYQKVQMDSFICPKSIFLLRFYESISFGIKCREYIKRNYENIDKIYMNSWPIFSQFFIVRIARKLKIPVVTHIQDVYPEALKSKLPHLIYKVFHFVLMPIDKFIFRNSDKIIAITEGMKSDLAQSRNCEKSKINVVINWHDEEEFINFHKINKVPSSINSNKIIFMYLGNVGPIAGVDFIVESFKSANIRDSELIIAGSGSERKNLEKMVNERQIRNVIFIDVPIGEVALIQSRADVMLLPVKKGGAKSSVPSKLPAYFFSKKPVLASVDMDSESADVIIKSNGGWVVEPDNPSVFAETLIRISNFSKKELQNIGNNGFTYAMDKFSKSSNLSLLLKSVLN